MTTQPYFNSIRKHLLDTLETANSHVFAAVCWFTNEDLFNTLCEKLRAGVNVELIILDDYINSNPFGCDFDKFISLGGHLYLSNVERPMHNKYCIIDNQTLINGSYNWTYFAETKNEENVIIFKNCPELIKAFLNDFKRLKGITQKVASYNKKPLMTIQNAYNEDKARNAFSAFNILSNDLFLKAIETNNKTIYQATKSIIPDNIAFQKKALELNWEKPIRLVSTISEKIHGDRISIIFPKDTLIPAQSRGSFTTISDNQQTMTITILRGESDQAFKNKRLWHFNIKGIPSLKAGVPSIKTDYKITSDGKLYVTKHIHDTGLINTKIFDLKHFNLLKNE